MENWTVEQGIKHAKVGSAISGIRTLKLQGSFAKRRFWVLAIRITPYIDCVCSSNFAIHRRYKQEHASNVFL
jgi:hypothetical protein